MAKMHWSSTTLRILGYLINNVNGIENMSRCGGSGAGRELFKLKNNADVRVAEGKMISNKSSQD